MALAYLQEASLIGAELIGADLQRASLVKANLMGVNLEGADLRGALLGGADLAGAILALVRTDQSTEWPAGFELNRHERARLTATSEKAEVNRNLKSRR
jgi:uncharacterized protein YjbI with pentapeptide repeats